jgi:hypothetical protein
MSSSATVSDDEEEAALNGIWKLLKVWLQPGISRDS